MMSFLQVTCAVSAVDSVTHRIELSANPKIVNNSLRATDITKVH